MSDITVSEEAPLEPQAQAPGKPAEQATKPEAQTQLIPIRDIECNQQYRLRRINEEAVAEKMESIKEVGLLHPITVTVNGIKKSGRVIYLLRAGMHRMEACKRLGWKEIPANISTLTGLRARLIEVDENLMQTKMTAVQRARFTAERKIIYEQLYPETAKGAAQGEGKKRSLGENGTDGNVCHETDKQTQTSFVAHTAATTGRPERAIRLDAEHGAKVAPDVLEAIEGTALDTGQTLHELKDLSHEEQRERIKEKAAQPRTKAPQPAESSPEEKHACDLRLAAAKSQFWAKFIIKMATVTPIEEWVPAFHAQTRKQLCAQGTAAMGAS